MIIYNNYQEYLAAYQTGKRNIKFISLGDGKPIDNTPFYTKPYSAKPDVDSIRDGSCT